MTDFIGTPDSVEIVATVPAQTSAVVAVPASVEASASVSAGTTAVVAKPDSVLMTLASSGGATNVLAKPASVELVAGVPAQPEVGMVPDSYDPGAIINLPVIRSGTVRTVLRPTTPASAGDQDRNSQIDSGHVIGPGSGVLDLSATVIADSQLASGTISYIKLYAFVSTDDTVPAPNVYVACTSPYFIIEVSGDGVNQYGLTSGSLPTGAGQLMALWTSANITTRPAGGAWTWTDINNLTELGVRASYALGTNEYTNLRLDEIWLEAWGPQGLHAVPIRVATPVGGPIRKTLRINVPGQGG